MNKTAFTMLTFHHGETYNIQTQVSYTSDGDKWFMPGRTAENELDNHLRCRKDLFKVTDWDQKWCHLSYRVQWWGKILTIFTSPSDLEITLQRGTFFLTSQPAFPDNVGWDGIMGREVTFIIFLHDTKKNTAAAFLCRLGTAIKGKKCKSKGQSEKNLYGLKHPQLEIAFLTASNWKCN